MASYLIEHFPSIAIALLRAGAWLVILSAIFVPLERLFAAHAKNARVTMSYDAVVYWGRVESAKPRS